MTTAIDRWNLHARADLHVPFLARFVVQTPYGMGRVTGMTD